MNSIAPGVPEGRPLSTPSAARLVFQALAQQIRPRPPVPLSQWLAQNLVLVDGPRAGELWSLQGAPYLAEIADCLTDEHPANLVTVRKSQQTGVSILGLGACLYWAERKPCNILYGVPGLDALRDLSGQKLQPLIDAWQRRTRRQVFAPVTSRSGAGSTTLEKKFPGGYLQLANANSAMDLSSRTIRRGVKDELSKWEDIPGRGDPETLFFGRFTAFRAEKSWKILEISTPEIDTGDPLGEQVGHCRIDRSFRRSDQRYWRMSCPHCGHGFTPTLKDLQIDSERPQASVLACPAHGCVITEPERRAAVREGRWVATAVGPDRHPGFHVDAFCSLMVSLGDIAEDWLKAQKAGERGLKDFHNLVLGLPYQMRGSAPDHVRLMERREAYAEGVVPPEALLLVAGVDVQHSGLWFEAVGYAPDRRSWSLLARFLPGDTTDEGRGAWAELASLLGQGLPDSFGRVRSYDLACIDAGDGGRAQIVHAFCRQDRERRRAVHGVAGWRAPPFGQPTKVTITAAGKRKRSGAMLWPVGVWSLKSIFYANLHKVGRAGGADSDPPGYCHFGTFLDEVYFRQITAETLVRTVVQGKPVQRWTALGENHLLDARVYAMAAAEMCGLGTNRPEHWAELRRLRGVPDQPLDLLTPEAVRVARADLPVGPAPDGETAGESEPARAADLPGVDPLETVAPRVLADPMTPLRKAAERLARARNRF